MKLIVFVIGLVLAAGSSVAQDWELSKSKNGIQVYTRKSENSPIKAFRVVTTIQGDPDEILNVIRDPSTYASWYDHFKKSEVISHRGEKTVYYVEMSLPFPFDNRDVVYEMTITKKDSAVEVRYYALKGVKEENDGLVRMEYAKGSWILSSFNRGSTTIEHEFEGDPKGNIPSGIVNMFLVHGPINTIERLKKYIRAQQNKE